MSPSQFQTLIARLDQFEEKFAARLTRVEVQLAAIIGGLILGSVLIGADVIHL